jgi:hypothetical protein
VRERRFIERHSVSSSVRRREPWQKMLEICPCRQAQVER